MLPGKSAEGWLDSKKLMFGSTNAAPAAASFRGTLLLFWMECSQDGKPGLFSATTANIGEQGEIISWTKSEHLKSKGDNQELMASSHAHTCIFKGRLYLFFKGEDTHIKFTSSSSEDNKNWLPPEALIDYRYGILTDADAPTTVPISLVRGEKLNLFFGSDDKVYTIYSKDLGILNEVKSWSDTTVSKDEGVFLIDLKVLASVILNDDDDDKDLFGKLFDFLLLVKNMQADEIREAKLTMDNAISKVNSIEGNYINLENVADGFNEASSSLGLIAVVLGWVATFSSFVPGGQPLALAAVTAAASASLAGAVATGVVSVATGTITEETQGKNLKENLSKVFEDAENEVTLKKALKAHESMDVLVHIIDKYRMHQTVFPAETFFVILCEAMDGAVKTPSPEAEAKQRFKDALQDFSNISDDPRVFELLTKLLPKFDEDIINAFDRNNTDHFHLDPEAKNIVAAAKTVLKVGLWIRLACIQRALIQRGFKGVKVMPAPAAINDVALKLFPKNVWAKVAQVDNLADVPQYVKRGALIVPAEGAESASKSIASGIFTQKYGIAAVQFIGVILDLWTIISTSIALKDRSVEHEKFRKYMLDVHYSFSDAIDEVQHFQRVYFPRDGDAIQAELDGLRQSQVKQARNYLEANIPEKGQMGMYIVNKSKYSFDVRIYPTWHGRWESGDDNDEILGWRDINKDVEKKQQTESDKSRLQILAESKTKMVKTVLGTSDWPAAGFSGMLLLYDDESKIQIPIWFYYNHTKPWEVMGAFANIRGFYKDFETTDAMWNHMKYEANEGNQFHSRGEAGGVIKNGVVRITFSEPSGKCDVTIEDG